MPADTALAWKPAESAGIKMTAVKKMILGVGDKAGPKPGGAGKLYFDDIGFGRPVK